MADGTDQVWVPDRRWQALDPEAPARRCRMLKCQERAIATLERSNGPWAYCQNHLYGRRFVDGQVEMAVHPDSPAAQRGYVY